MIRLRQAFLIGPYILLVHFSVFTIAYFTQSDLMPLNNIVVCEYHNFTLPKYIYVKLLNFLSSQAVNGLMDARAIAGLGNGLL
ncbi:MULTISPECIES: hypothetical protein [Nostocales]|uniref:Uncharacterized protein n=4 Tax=Nostocales TaxID=1161 RepID=A0A8S9T1E2_9CYAN|nr:hypothetical protein [Tolypothrix bouteillei]KAF3886165.1 hypothetical protein DA73_0400012305 [Tolypothrix bouteillei VB521301]